MMKFNKGNYKEEDKRLYQNAEKMRDSSRTSGKQQKEQQQKLEEP